jgi:hypothetical protein
LAKQQTSTVEKMIAIMEIIGPCILYLLASSIFLLPFGLFLNVFLKYLRIRSNKVEVVAKPLCYTNNRDAVVSIHWLHRDVNGNPIECIVVGLEKDSNIFKRISQNNEMKVVYCKEDPKNWMCADNIQEAPSNIKCSIVSLILALAACGGACYGITVLTTFKWHGAFSESIEANNRYSWLIRMIPFLFSFLGFLEVLFASGGEKFLATEPRKYNLNLPEDITGKEIAISELKCSDCGEKESYMKFVLFSNTS